MKFQQRHYNANYVLLLNDKKGREVKLYLLWGSDLNVYHKQESRVSLCRGVSTKLNFGKRLK